ncbi:hypothetical protein ACJX0J_018493, partial [Zea mays]
GFETIVLLFLLLQIYVSVKERTKFGILCMFLWGMNFECFLFWTYMCTIIQLQVIKFKPSFVIYLSNQSYYLPYLHIIILLQRQL